MFKFIIKALAFCINMHMSGWLYTIGLINYVATGKSLPLLNKLSLPCLIH